MHEIDEENNVANVSLVYRSARGHLSYPDATPRVGMLNVTYDDRDDGDVNYYILGTDYYNYAITWGCENLENDQSREYAWILTRMPSLDPEDPRDAEVLARIETYVEQYLDRNFFETTEQGELCSSVRRNYLNN